MDAHIHRVCKRDRVSETETGRYREGVRETKIERQRDRDKETHRKAETETETKLERDTEKQRHRDAQRKKLHRNRIENGIGGILGYLGRSPTQ